MIQIAKGPEKTVDQFVSHEFTKWRQNDEIPDIVYQGDLEVQAASAVGLPEWDEPLEE